MYLSIGQHHFTIYLYLNAVGLRYVLLFTYIFVRERRWSAISCDELICVCPDFYNVIEVSKEWSQWKCSHKQRHKTKLDH